MTNSVLHSCRAGGDPGCAIAWAGPGAVAFAGSIGGGHSGPEVAGTPTTREPLRMRCSDDLPGMARADSGSGLVRALRDFFEAGGKECLALDDPRLEDPTVPWIGEDAGPGYRSGVYALADSEDVGTVILAGRCTPRVVEWVLELARRKPDVLFLLGAESPAELPPPEPSFSLVRRNAGVLHGPERAAPGLGAVAAVLEARDFRAELPFAGPSMEPPPWISRRDLLRLEAWRRVRGLERSLDAGTRWVVFELNHPFLWGRVEREVTLFLRRLETMGFVAPGRGQPTFEVACGPAGMGEAAPGQVAMGEVTMGEAPMEKGTAGQGTRWDSLGTGMAIHVTARLSEPYGSALAPPAGEDSCNRRV